MVINTDVTLWHCGLVVKLIGNVTDTMGSNDTGAKVSATTFCVALSPSVDHHNCIVFLYHFHIFLYTLQL